MSEHENANQLLTKELARKLVRNGIERFKAQEAGKDEPDVEPVVKLFTPDAHATWLLSELDPKDPDLAFGLCDLGLGFPELGDVRMSQIAGVRGALGLLVERDLYWTAKGPLSAYAEAARAEQRIVELPS